MPTTDRMAGLLDAAEPTDTDLLAVLSWLRRRARWQILVVAREDVAERYTERTGEQLTDAQWDAVEKHLCIEDSMLLLEGLWHAVDAAIDQALPDTP